MYCFKNLKTATFYFIIISVICLLNACSKEIEHKEVGSEYAPYIAAYTSGTISKASTINIRFTDAVVSESEIGKELSSSPFSFKPSVKGTTVWIDRQTIEFRPDRHLEAGKRYLTEFNLKSIIEVPEHLGTLSFTFDILQQTFDIQFGQLSYIDRRDLSKQQLSGTISTADITDLESVKKILTVTQNAKNLPVEWTGESSQRSYKFLITDIKRHEKEQGELKISWNGDPIQTKEKGERKITIPALRDFKVVEILTFMEPEPHLIIRFSDPLSESQDIGGMVRVDNSDELRLIIDGQDLHVYPERTVSGEINLILEQSIENVMGYQLESSFTSTVIFESLDPAVRLLTSGSIIPVKGRITVPFQAVNLKAVDIGVYRVFEKNIPQFLQVNQIDGDYELRRVGELIAYQTVRLDEAEDFNAARWQSYESDLTELVKLDPGAIYFISIMFKPSYSTYACLVTESEFEEYKPVTVSIKDFPEKADSEFWSQYYHWGRVWREREDPCKPSYYNRNRWQSRNLLATDLGISAKMGGDKNMHIMINNLNSTEPMSNVDVQVLSYQQKVIAGGKTGRNGKVTLKVNREPYLVIANYGDQKSYLRVDNNNALSVSRFDVSGQEVQHGIKGFIYGERDVWRPGDTLFLSFILEDKPATLPDNHPVMFELIDPKGIVQQKFSRTSSVGGIYTIQPRTSQDAETGNWQLRVTVGAAIFTSRISIETIMPNRLRTELKFVSKELDNFVIQRDATFKSNWLHGAAASGLNADLYVKLTQAKTVFSGYSQFTFDDPSRRFESERQKVFEGKLNNNGEAVFRPRIHVESQAPGLLNATFTARVFEAGGNFSTEVFSVPYHPYPVYVGLSKPEGDSRYGILTNNTDHTVDLVALDRKGQIATNRKVKVSLYKIQWRWWWDRSSNRISAYSSNVYKNLIAEDNIALHNGKGQWKFNVPHPEWGRYLIRVCDADGGHCSGDVIYIDWPGWADRTDRGADAGATMLNFFIEKETYQPGEKIKLTIPSPDNARALVSVENGTGILESHWVETTGSETQFVLEAKKSWTPNIYVHITLLQPHVQTLNDRPIRMYGVLPLKIEDPDTRLAPKITTPASYEPEKKASITVEETSGKPMSYTLAVVDEGLLNITRFMTPEPWKHFYAREALGVRTWDIYDQVSGAISGDMSRLLAIGGDLEIKPEDADKANRFIPVVRFFGPFHLNANRKATHEFMMPNYIGSVRVMVVGVHKGAYGSAEKHVPVKSPLMVLSTLPRVLGPGEEVNLPVTVFAMENDIRQVTVNLAVNDLMEISGEKTKEIRFDKTGEQVVYFKVKTKERIGIGRSTVTVSSNAHRATHEIELDVRNPNPYITDVYSGTIAPGAAWDHRFTPLGMHGTNNMMLEVSAVPPVNLAKRLHYLISYPHGCLEQTVSSVFPQLYLSELVELSSLQSLKVQENIQTGINKIRNMQLGNGALSFWQGQSNINDWSTIYAGHFMVEAKKAGYPVPESFLNRWQAYLSSNANSWNRDNTWIGSDIIQAYRLYVLALNGTPQPGAMNRMRNMEGLSNAALWRLAAAYHISGRKQVAEELIQNATTKVSPYNELSGTFGSDVRDKAMILEALVMMGRLNDAAILAREISVVLSRNDWMSTQATAYCLMSMSRFAKVTTTGKPMSFSYSVQNESQANINSSKPVWQYEWNARTSNESSLQVKNNSDQMLFVQFVKRGQPFRQPVEPAESNIQLRVRYLDMQGNEIDPRTLVQGTDFIAEARIYNPGIRGRYQELALNRIFPSSWEIHNERIGDNISFVTFSEVDHQDIRDDRVYTYFSLGSGHTKTFQVVLNAAYAGTTYLPPVVVEAMYDNTIHARNSGMEVNVTERR